MLGTEMHVIQSLSCHPLVPKFIYHCNIYLRVTCLNGIEYVGITTKKNPNQKRLLSGAPNTLKVFLTNSNSINKGFLTV